MLKTIPLLSILNRANQSSRIFNQSKEISNIFNKSVQDDQIIYKGNGNVPTSATSDLYHDGKVCFSSNGLVQDRSNLDDVQDFTLGRTSRPQAEIMPSIEPSTPTINFKIEVINQVSGRQLKLNNWMSKQSGSLLQMNWISSFQERYRNL